MRITKNQFLFAPESVIPEHKIACATSFALGEYKVYLGEDCHHVSVQSEERYALLVGYIIDAKGQDQEETLLRQFLEGIEDDSRNVASCVRYWGGRWSLIYKTSSGLNVITDTCGLKQVFYYSFLEKGNLTIASQARYLAETYGLSYNKQAEKYIDSARQIDKEYSWPLDGCLYKRVKRLLPNHILSEGKKGIERMASNKRISKEPTIEMTGLLRTQMYNLQTKRKCAVTVTAGWDSRLVLAAADKKDVKMKPVTLLYVGLDENNADVRVSRELCDRIRLNHQLIRCSTVRDEFEKACRQHCDEPHEYWLQMSQAIADAGLSDYFWVKGSCNEVLRASSGVLYGWQVSAKVLCKLFMIHYDDYSASIINDWLKGAVPFSKQYGINLLDLFYWEHRCGSWLAECLNESDIAGEMFAPFNCRAYIEAGLNVKYGDRVSPDYSLFREMLKQLSFDLNIPINKGRYSSLKSKVQCMIKNKLHLLYGLTLCLKPLP